MKTEKLLPGGVDYESPLLSMISVSPETGFATSTGLGIDDYGHEQFDSWD